MGNKFLKSLLIVIFSFTSSSELEACSRKIFGNTTTSDSASSDSTVSTSEIPTTSDFASSNSTVSTSEIPTTSDSASSNSTISTSEAPTTSDSTTSNNQTTDTTSDSSTVPHSHNYNQQVVTDEYKAADADCEHAATYYYSCSCGDLGTETFEYGSPLGHDYQWEYFETSNGEYGQREKCSICDKIGEIKYYQSVNNLSFAVISEEEKTCKVIGYKKYYNDERDNNICIPKMWNDYKVTSIDNHSFSYCTSLSSVVIPDSVTSIEEYAFYECSSLISILIPDSVTSIGECAFSYCTSLSSIVIPDSVTSIGYSAFSYCTSLSSVTIGNGVTSIGDYAFSGCTSLSSIIVKEGNTVYDSREDCNAIIETSTNTLFVGCASTIIPDSVTSIGDYAFDGCTSLSSIVIPDSVTSIGNSAFSGCTSLTTIRVEEGNTVYDSRNNCNAIIETSTNRLIFGCASTIIPDSVTSIGECAFSYCTSLTSIVIPDSVTSIEEYAFYECSSLISIVIPDSVTSIGPSVFSYCASLSSIVIPNSVTEISWEAFYECTSLADVYYAGTEEQWNAISIDSNNDALYSATIHYNYKG